MPRVKIPTAYTGPTSGESLVHVDGTTVIECLEALGARYPGFRELVLDGGGKVQKFVTLCVNGDELDRDAVDTPLASDDELEIVASLSGG